jgi:hypothetical protein
LSHSRWCGSGGIEAKSSARRSAMATAATYVGFQGSYLSNEQSGTNQGIYF